MGWSRRPVLVLTPETLQLYGRHLPGCLIVRLHALPSEARHRAGTRRVYLTDDEFEDLHKQDRCNPPPADHHGPGGHRRGRFARARSSVAVVVVIVRRLHQLRSLSVSRAWDARVAGRVVGLVRRSGCSG